MCADEGDDERTALYSGVDAGAAMAGLIIEAVARGLIAHPMAGFDVDGARQAFALDAGLRPLMIIAVGSWPTTHRCPRRWPNGTGVPANGCRWSRSCSTGQDLQAWDSCCSWSAMRWLSANIPNTPVVAAPPAHGAAPRPAPGQPGGELGGQLGQLNRLHLQSRVADLLRPLGQAVGPLLVDQVLGLRGHRLFGSAGCSLTRAAWAWLNSGCRSPVCTSRTVHGRTPPRCRRRPR